MLEETGMILEFEDMLNKVGFVYNEIDKNIKFFEDMDRNIVNCDSLGFFEEEECDISNIREGIFECVILRIIIEFYNKKGKLLVCSEVMNFLEECEIYKEYVKGIVRGEGKRIVKMMIGKIYDLYEKGLSEWE